MADKQTLFKKITSATKLEGNKPARRPILFKKPQLRIRRGRASAAIKAGTPPREKTVLDFFADPNQTRYEMLGVVGEGGMGQVYTARDRMLNLTVALKFLPPHLVEKTEALEAFKNEARIVMQLSHQNIVKLHNLESGSAGLFLIMEYVDGRDFRAILKDLGRLSLGSVVQIVRSCAKALDYAHSRSVLHKDLKPANLMLDKESCLKIVDFGIAGQITGADEMGGDYLEGTIPYISPEQIEGLPLDQRCDVYSLGAVIYELLSGRPVFSPQTAPEELLELDPELIPGLNDGIMQALLKALAKDRDVRWRSAGDFYQALSSAHLE
jgi:serine/threonine-protein kinase